MRRVGASQVPLRLSQTVYMEDRVECYIDRIRGHGEHRRLDVSFGYGDGHEGMERVDVAEFTVEV